MSAFHPKRTLAKCLLSTHCGHERTVECVRPYFCRRAATRSFLSVRDFPYSAGVPSTLKHRRSRGPVRKQRLTEGSGETADCITGSDVRRRFGCRTPCKRPHPARRVEGSYAPTRPIRLGIEECFERPAVCGHQSHVAARHGLPGRRSHCRLDDLDRQQGSRDTHRGVPHPGKATRASRSEEHTSELQSHSDLVCRLLLEKKKKK